MKSFKLNVFQKGLYIISWIPVILIKLLLAIVGLLAVLIGLAFGKQSESWPKLLWIWGNNEEGYPEWAKKQDIGAWHWYAIRNPVNNMRYIFEDRAAHISGNWTEPQMEAQDLIDRRMRRAYRWSYNGLFAGYRKIWLTKPYYNDNHLQQEYSEMWIGWKIGSTVPGMGFTMQYRRNVEVGK